MARPGGGRDARTSRRFSVGHSYYLVIDDGGAAEPFPAETTSGRFVYPGTDTTGGATVFTGTFSGPVEVLLEVLDAPPAPEPSDAWDEREDHELRALGEHIVPFESLGQDRGFARLEVEPGASYHLRVHARGREAGRGHVTGPELPVEHHLVQLWPT